MKQLNIAIEDETYRRAKVASAAKGVILRKWVEDLILAATEGSLVLREDQGGDRG